MAYAPANRPMYDADSHIMELPDFLQKYADPELRADIPAVSYSASLVTDEEVGVIMARGGRHSEEHVAEMIAMGDSLIERVKEIQALGAFDGGERSKAMDILGFKKQLVFATHSVTMPFSPSSKIPPKLRYGAARAHNRHMADFCAHDSRLMGVAVVPLDEPAFALDGTRVRAQERCESHLGCASSGRRQIARPRRARSVLGAVAGVGHSVRHARRRLSAATGPRRGPTTAVHRPKTGWAAARTSAPRTSPCCTRVRKRSSR